jgi:hypothetical protein
MVFGAGGAVAFAGIFIAEAGELVATADAIAVAGFGGCLDGNERHGRGIVRFPRYLCKRVASGEARRRVLSSKF